MKFRNYDVIEGVRKVESSLVMEEIDLGGGIKKEGQDKNPALV